MRVASLEEIDTDDCSLLILDFDGVVLDLPLDWSALKSELEEHCQSEFGSPVSFRTLNSGRQIVREREGSEALARVDALILQWELEALECSSPRADFLGLLERRGLPELAICSSNGRSVVERALDAIGVRSRFAAIVGREDVTEPKPSPEGLLAILARLDRAAEHAAFVGDRPTDVQAGRAAGIEAYLLAPERDPEDQRLERLAAGTDYVGGFNELLVHYRARLIRELVPRGGHLVDVGCGPGKLTAALEDHFDRVTAVDGAAQLVAEARTRLGPKARCIHALIEDYRPEDAIDCVVASGLLEHVEDPVGLLRRLSPFVSDRGSIVVIVPNASSLHRRMGVAMGAISHLKELQEHDHRFGHRRYYDLPQLRQDVTEAGLQVEHESGIMIKPLPNAEMETWPRERLDALFDVGRQAPDWCAEILVLCTPRAPTA